MHAAQTDEEEPTPGFYDRGVHAMHAAHTDEEPPPGFYDSGMDAMHAATKTKRSHHPASMIMA